MAYARTRRACARACAARDGSQPTVDAWRRRRACQREGTIRATGTLPPATADLSGGPLRARRSFAGWPAPSDSQRQPPRSRPARHLRAQRPARAALELRRTVGGYRRPRRREAWRQARSAGANVPLDPCAPRSWRHFELEVFGARSGSSWRLGLWTATPASSPGLNSPAWPCPPRRRTCPCSPTARSTQLASFSGQRRGARRRFRPSHEGDFTPLSAAPQAQAPQSLP